MYLKVILIRSIFKIFSITMLNSVVYGQLRINDLIANSVEATYKLYTMYELDVINHYKLDERPEFSSELKTKIFMQSTEYKNMLNSLMKEKKDMFNYTYYINDKKGNIGNYVLSCGCFQLNINGTIFSSKDIININYPDKTNILFFDAGEIPKERIIYFNDNVAVSINQLPIKKLQDNYNYLFINVPETTALQMENSNNISVYYFFNPSAYKQSVYSPALKTFIWSKLNKGTHRVFVADGLRMVVADNETGKIFYDKIYSVNGLFPMKGGLKKIYDDDKTISLLTPSKKVETVKNDSLFKKSAGGSGPNGTIGKAVGTDVNFDDVLTKIREERDLNDKINAKESYFKGGFFDVSGWAITSRPIVNDDSDETGKIVFQIKVNESGEVTTVRQVQSTLSPSVSELYRRAVSRLQLRYKGGGAIPSTTIGTITFTVKTKD